MSKKNNESSASKDQIIQAILAITGTPKNLVKVEAFNYNFGEGKNDRWRINYLLENDFETDYGMLIPKYTRPHSYFVHFDSNTSEFKYSNPPLKPLQC